MFNFAHLYLNNLCKKKLAFKTRNQVITNYVLHLVLFFIKNNIICCQFSLDPHFQPFSLNKIHFIRFSVQKLSYFSLLFIYLCQINVYFQKYRRSG